MGKAVLQLNVYVSESEVVECAQHLIRETVGSHRAILVALAAEILTESERQAAGSAVVVVTGAASADRVLRDLKASASE